jgi:P27 family predicted phage terminase small subunit
MSGSRGPISMPDNVRQLRGNPGKRSTPPAVRAVVAAPNPPSWLSREAAAEWRRVIPELKRLQILSKVDRGVLASYCQTWSQYVDNLRRERKALKIAAQLQKDLDATTGIEERKEAWDALDRAWSQADRAQKGAASCTRLLIPLAVQIGCTPNARLRMKPPEKDNPGEEDLD